MLSNFKNFLILKSDETNEEHLAKIEHYDTNNKKLQLRLIDDEKNLSYRKGSNINVLIPDSEDLYKFQTEVIYYDIIERILSITYPEEVEVIHRRKEKRFPLKLLIEAKIGESTLDSITFDISLSGLSFIAKTDKICHVGDYVEIKIKLEKSNIQNLWIKILNKRTIDYMDKTYILYGGEFEELSADSIDELLILLNENSINLIN